MQILPATNACLVIALMTVVCLLPLDAAAAESASSSSPASLFAYFGTYTGTKSKGIYVSRFDPSNGSFTAPELAAEVVNPSFLAVHPRQTWIFAANETDSFGGKRTGAVSAFSIDKTTGKLTLLNQQPSGGTGPCHVGVDKTGVCVMAANYGSGSVATFKVGPDGRLSDPVSVIEHRGSSINPQRQAGPHAHQLVTDPANRFVLTCDLGLDQVLVSKLAAAEARLSAHEPPAAALAPGSGPRHLAFHPNGRFVYVLNELNSTLASFSYNAKSGTLNLLRTVSTLPPDFQGRSSGAEIQVHPSGRYVYSSNRGDDSIAIFGINAKTGEARYIGREPSQGKTPRHFAINPAGQWLIVENQDSDSVVVFRIDKQTGLLSATGQTLQAGSPVCLVFAAAK